MSDKNDKEQNLNFDEYIRQGEPQKNVNDNAKVYQIII